MCPVDLQQKLSPHFSLSEMVKRDTALRLGIENIPDSNAIESLTLLCNEVLELVRERFSIPFSPSSGYRSDALNTAVGGSSGSQHCLGEAVDFEIPGIDNRSIASFISSNLNFDQLILEHYTPGIPASGWVHVSLDGETMFVVSPTNRSDVVSYNNGQYTDGLT